MVLLLFLKSPRIFLLLFFKQLLLELGILPLLNLHKFIPSYLLFCVLKSLLVLLDVQMILKMNLLFAVMHLCLEVTTYSMVLVPLKHVFQWEIVRGMGTIEEGPVLEFSCQGESCRVDSRRHTALLQVRGGSIGLNSG